MTNQRARPSTQSAWLAEVCKKNPQDRKENLTSPPGQGLAISPKPDRLSIKSVIRAGTWCGPQPSCPDGFFWFEVALGSRHPPSDLNTTSSRWAADRSAPPSTLLKDVFCRSLSGRFMTEHGPTMGAIVGALLQQSMCKAPRTDPVTKLHCPTTSVVPFGIFTVLELVRVCLSGPYSITYISTSVSSRSTAVRLLTEDLQEIFNAMHNNARTVHSYMGRAIPYGELTGVQSRTARGCPALLMILPSTGNRLLRADMARWIRPRSWSPSCSTPVFPCR